MKLFIHAGCHKTGTTSFQIFCASNSQRLGKFGVLYPVFHKKRQHSHLMWSVQRSGSTILEEYIAKCHRCAADGGCHCVLLSGEDFENCLVEVSLAREVERIARDVGFSEICWVVVSKDVLSYVDSIYSQMSRHDIVLNYDTLITAAFERGCLYASSKNYDYIFALNISRFIVAFENGVGGKVVRFGMDEFVRDSPGAPVLRLIMGEEAYADFNSNCRLVYGPQNRKLSDFRVEYNYCSNFLGFRRGMRFKAVRRTCAFLCAILVAGPRISKRCGGVRDLHSELNRRRAASSRSEIASEMGS